ncbi:Gfo/Idh/MocA family oxidoreductase [Pelagicoccus enzymogenes]|uniref:Gfo/Idh/MocA family protein n=1 Tax=Pelagicoccus enzymogenes TaxID=2773457 RepID=UPI0028109243|nr:Gfo/Idh/MocA family oxidoreductase [Pelagicoccus enzymogenes]MDQ8197071.1 Gfo/Idh/MocA family oxidoreductase [Pelagicoccus enzymogenes]
MIKAALIGVSSYGRVHLRMIDHMVAKGRLELVAATVINQEEEAELCAKLEAGGCQLFRDYKEMLAAWNGRLDLCMIPTPIFLHEDMTLDALDAGANVLIEKPLAPELSACRRIAERAEKRGRFVAVGFQKMHCPATRRIKRDLLSGVLGELREIRGITLWPRGLDYFSRNAWAGRLRAGDSLVLDSPVSNAAAHFLHLMLYWAGADLNEVASIAETLRAETFRANDIENFDTACLRGTTKEGVPVTFVASHACRQTVNPTIRIVGSKGEIEWIKDEAAYYRVDGEAERTVALSGDEEEVRSMIEAIVCRIEGTAADLCEPEQAIPHTEVVEALYREVETQTVAEEFIEEIETAEGRFRVVKGLEEAAVNAFERGALFSEVGVRWDAGKPLPLRK